MKTHHRSARARRSMHTGLSRCRHSNSPLTHFMAELRAEGTWGESDLSIIESSIRDVLAKVIRSRSRRSRGAVLPTF